MRYFKIYSNACRVSQSIKEISKKDAEQLIIDEVLNFDSPEIFEPFNGIELDSDEEINKAYDQVCSDAVEYFENHGLFGCGNFEIRCIADDDEEPTSRPNSCDLDVNNIY